jgi:hypothetical protein
MTRKSMMRKRGRWLLARVVMLGLAILMLWLMERVWAPSFAHAVMHAFVRPNASR